MMTVLSRLFVCLSDCLSATISTKLFVRFSPIFTALVLLWRRCDMIYFRFMNDVMYVDDGQK